MATTAEKKSTLLAALAEGPMNIHSMHAAVIRLHPEERKLPKHRTGSVRLALAVAGLIEPADQKERNGMWRLAPKGQQALKNQRASLHPVQFTVVSRTKVPISNKLTQALKNALGQIEHCKLVIRHTTKGSTYTFTQGTKVFVFNPDVVDQIIE